MSLTPPSLVRRRHGATAHRLEPLRLVGQRGWSLHLTSGAVWTVWLPIDRPGPEGPPRFRVQNTDALGRPMSPVESGPIRHPERYGTWSNPEDLADFTRAYFGLADRPTPVEVAAA